MLRKVLLSLGAVVAVFVIAGYFNRESLSQEAIRLAIGPEHSFDEQPAPAAPDYARVEAWAALPELVDNSDELPAELEPRSAPASVSVFFVHPTTFTSKTAWNQPLYDEPANWVLEERVLRHQASVFNGCCDIYAPRYRQATFFSFLDRDGDGGRALKLAYDDVARAFEAFLDAIGTSQPFMLAGHSQGSLHGARLLREKIAGTPLEDRLVAAYLIGYAITAEQLGGVPVCASARDTGCMIGWNSVEGDGEGIFNGQPYVCVNPLSWQHDEGPAAHEKNLGGIGFPGWQETNKEEAQPELVSRMRLEPAVADARCDDHQLRVSELRSQSFPSRMPGDSTHIYDYGLYYANLRENARARVSAFLGADVTVSGAGTGAP